MNFRPSVNDVHRPPESTIAALSSDSESLLDQPSVVQSEPAKTLRPPLPWKRLGGVGLLVIGVLAVGFLIFHSLSSKNNQAALQAETVGTNTNVKLQSLPLSGISKQLSPATTQHIDTVTVNGQVNVGNSLVLSPITKPTSAVPGQIYYDQTTNLLSYYDGTAFVVLQGGGNVTNNITNVTNNAAPITNVTNITNVSGGGTAITLQGSVGTLAMFTGSSALGDSFITQGGTTVNVGGLTINAGAAGNNESVNLGSPGGTSTTNLQGGTGGVNVLTGNAAGASGDINIISGDSSTISSGNINIDNGVSTINGLTLESYTFETIGDVGSFEGTYIGFFNLSQNCTVSHSGNCSLQMTGFGTGGGSIVETQQHGVGVPGGTFPLTPGHKYAFSVWVKAATPSDVTTVFADAYGWANCFAGTTDSSTVWKNIVWSCTAPVGLGDSFVQFGYNSGLTVTHYFDDITVTDVSSSATQSQVNIGTTNAQAINIGNNNELGPTSILGGGGININSNINNTDISGGSINLNSIGNATFASSEGGMLLQSIGGTTIGVTQNQSTGNGSDVAIYAGSPSDGVSNGGDVILQGGAAVGTGSGGSVIVKPQTDSSDSFQVQNAAGTSIVNVNTNTILINDPMTLNAPTGTLNGSAAWVNGQYVELNNGNRQAGAVSYTPTLGNDFDATFNFWSQGGADSTFLYAYNTSVPGNPNGYGSTSGGYIFNYDEFHADAEIWFNGTEIASAPVANIANGTWHAAEVVKNGDVLTMKMDGSTLLTFTDIPRILTGNDFGIEGYSGLFSGEHRTDDLILSSGIAPAQMTVAASSQFTSDVNISGGLTASTMQTNQLLSPLVDSANGTLLIGTTYAQTIDIGAGLVLTNTGSAIYKTVANNSTGFQIQDAGNMPLFTADTIGKTITVSGTDTTFAALTLTNAHFISTQTTPPGIGAPANCGTTPTAAILPGSTDSAGSFTVTTGSGGTASSCDVQITFHQPYGSTPKSIIVEGRTDVPSVTRQIYVSASSSNSFTTSFAVSAGGANNTTYTYNYWVVD